MGLHSISNRLQLFDTSTCNNFKNSVKHEFNKLCDAMQEGHVKARGTLDLQISSLLPAE
jgi:hypothetical protein